MMMASIHEKHNNTYLHERRFLYVGNMALNRLGLVYVDVCVKYLFKGVVRVTPILGGYLIIQI